MCIRHHCGYEALLLCSTNWNGSPAPVASVRGLTRSAKVLRRKALDGESLKAYVKGLLHVALETLLQTPWAMLGVMLQDSLRGSLNYADSASLHVMQMLLNSVKSVGAWEHLKECHLSSFADILWLFSKCFHDFLYSGSLLSYFWVSCRRLWVVGCKLQLGV